MKKISLTISKIIGNVCPSLSLNAELKSEWNNIVKKELLNLTEFSEAKYGKNNEIVVIVNVLNSAAVLFRYESEEIKANILKLTGASKVKLIIKQVSNLEAQDAA